MADPDKTVFLVVPPRRVGTSLNHLTGYHEYLDAAMEKLRAWLRNPPHPVPPPGRGR